jgi:hypothetical protein
MPDWEREQHGMEVSTHCIQPAPALEQSNPYDAINVCGKCTDTFCDMHVCPCPVTAATFAPGVTMRWSLCAECGDILDVRAESRSKYGLCLCCDSIFCNWCVDNMISPSMNVFLKTTPCRLGSAANPQPKIQDDFVGGLCGLCVRDLEKIKRFESCPAQPKTLDTNNISCNNDTCASSEKHSENFAVATENHDGTQDPSESADEEEEEEEDGSDTHTEQDTGEKLAEKKRRDARRNAIKHRKLELVLNRSHTHDFCAAWWCILNEKKTAVHKRSDETATSKASISQTNPTSSTIQPPKSDLS